jgi:hypothetical protein
MLCFAHTLFTEPVSATRRDPDDLFFAESTLNGFCWLPARALFFTRPNFRGPGQWRPRAAGSASKLYIAGYVSQT